MEEPTKYFEPSNVADFFTEHVEALLPAADLECGKCFMVPSGSFSVDLLRDIVHESYSVGNKAIIVIDHGKDGFEIRRFPDGYNTKLFYKYLRNAVKKGSETVIEGTSAISEMKRICKQYMNFDVEQVQKYDKSITDVMQASGIVPYAYIQRRMASLTVIKETGKSEAIQAAVKELVKTGELKEISKKEAKELHNKKAKLYQINF